MPPTYLSFLRSWDHRPNCQIVCVCVCVCVCLCVYVCVWERENVQCIDSCTYTYTCIHICVHMQIKGWHWTSVLFTYFSDAESFTVSGAHWFIEMPHQDAPSIPVSISLALGLHVHAVCTQCLTWELVKRFHACMLKLFTGLAFSLDPLLSFYTWGNRGCVGHRNS